ncbi:MAG: type II toxin-antitoxin system prevent-host-death family antitoxin [Candidatus Latescibacteria bacterium]|nr:type II toxin-antitoxin system prevent-host-death family antitoxin [Candidatus Latescibacterota bacterium]
MGQVDLKEAQEHLLELVKRAAKGEEVVISQANKPLAKLISATPSPPAQQRQFGSAKGLIEMADDFDEPLEDFREYM